MKILYKIFFKISYIIISMCFLTICKFHGHFLGIRRRYYNRNHFYLWSYDCLWQVLVWDINEVNHSLYVFININRMITRKYRWLFKSLVILYIYISKIKKVKMSLIRYYKIGNFTYYNWSEYLRVFCGTNQYGDVFFTYV